MLQTKHYHTDSGLDAAMLTVEFASAKLARRWIRFVEHITRMQAGGDSKRSGPAVAGELSVGIPSPMLRVLYH